MGSKPHQDLLGATQVHPSLQYQSKIITGDLTAPTGLANAILSKTFNTQNLISNSDFELWDAGTSNPPNNWSSFGPSPDASREGTLIRFSSYSAKIVRAGASVGGLRQTVHSIADTGGLAYMKGRRYSFSCWVYNTDSYASGVRITLTIDHQSSSQSNHHQGTGWELLTVSALIGNASTYVYAQLNVAHLSGTGTAYFDGAMFVEGNAPCAWRPRSVEGAAAAGDTIERTFTETGHGFAVKDVVMFDGSNWVKAQADSAANAESPWVVKSVTTNTFVAVWSGYISGLSGLTAGTVYFLDDDTAGLLTTTEPTDIGDISLPMLVALSATTGVVLNKRGMVITGAVTVHGWEMIEEVIVGAGGSVSVSFTSIPGTYRTLVLAMNLRSERDGGVEYDRPYIRFNSDSGNNYDYLNLFEVGSNVDDYSAGRAANFIYVGYCENSNSRASCFSPCIIQIPQYVNTDIEKYCLCRSILMGDRSVDADLIEAHNVGAWRNTSAITSILIALGSASDIAEDSVITLYGIK